MRQHKGSCSLCDCCIRKAKTKTEKLYSRLVKSSLLLFSLTAGFRTPWGFSSLQIMGKSNLTPLLLKFISHSTNSSRPVGSYCTVRVTSKTSMILSLFFKVALTCCLYVKCILFSWPNKTNWWSDHYSLKDYCQVLSISTLSNHLKNILNTLL